MPRSRYSNRPALDGIRGVAMVTFMAFHFGVSWLQGAWVGINLFFVLSGFLIVRLLLEERVTYGDISVVSFYRRRMRRLLPGLFLLLGTLAVYGLLFAEDNVRRAMRGDILATLGYVMNWRLIVRDDQYFEMFGNPSFLRHAWTLAVEEQFYLVAPFLVGALVLLLRQRWMQITALLALAVVSAAWTAHIGVATPGAQTHAYYGTDTRAQALLIGAALAFALGPKSNGRNPSKLSTSTLAVLGWGGLGAAVAAYIFIAPFASWMYDFGGMFAFSLGFAALVTACADNRPSLLTKLLGAGPVSYLGKLSYGLYLWHWPIHLWIEDLMPRASTLLQLSLGMLLTVLIASLSYELIERPVMRRGVRGLSPMLHSGRILTAASVAALLLGAYTVGKVPPGQEAAAQAATAGPAVNLVAGTPAYKPKATKTTVGIFGDSVPYLLLEYMPKATYTDLNMVNLAEPGCDLVDIDIRWTPDQRGNNTKKCLDAKSGAGQKLKAANADIFLLMTGSLVSIPHITPANKVLTIDDPEFQRMIVGKLEDLRKQAIGAGVKQVQVATVPCRDDVAKYIPEEYRPFMVAHPEIAKTAADPVKLNALVRSWAGTHGVPVIDVYNVLCSDGYQPTRNGIELFGDGIHFSAEATPMMWTWLAPQIRSAYERRTGGSQ